MTRTVLYYPTINIPDKQWLRQAVMYYDNVASIVPESLWDVFPISPELQLLKSNGIFKEIRPFDLFLKNEEFHEFEKNLKSIIESKEFQWVLKAESKLLDSRVHKDKVAISIFNYLQVKGLATEDPADHGWYRFERKTALIYMSVLAAQLAQIKDSTIPSTDKKTYHDFLFAPKKQEMEFRCSQIIFNNVLPVPHIDVPIEKIIRFKNNHIIELLNFRKAVEEFEKKIMTAGSTKDLVDLGVYFGEEIRQKSLILGEELTHENISSRWHSLSTLLKDIRTTINENLPISMKLATFGGAVGGPPGAIIGGAAGMVPGIVEKGISYHAFNIDVQYQQRAQIRDHPFGYIYSANKEGIC
jgi:hypothetical protein